MYNILRCVGAGPKMTSVRESRKGLIRITTTSIKDEGRYKRNPQFNKQFICAEGGVSRLKLK